MFGEHQDYLGLPVIAMAMNRRCHLEWTPRTDTRVVITSEELGEVGGFELAALDQVQAANPLEVVAAGLMAESGGTPAGMDVHIRSDIPIQAGCSSSTALLTAWTAGWSKAMNVAHSTEELVRRCHHAEVLAFDGAGGDMDISLAPTVDSTGLVQVCPNPWRPYPGPSYWAIRANRRTPRAIWPAARMRACR